MPNWLPGEGPQIEEKAPRRRKHEVPSGKSDREKVVTQLRILRERLEKLAADESTKELLARVLDEMTNVLHKAQNGPPEGHGDGSLPEVEWYVLRTFVGELRSFLRAYEQMRSVFEHAPDDFSPEPRRQGRRRRIA